MSSTTIIIAVLSSIALILLGVIIFFSITLGTTQKQRKKVIELQDAITNEQIMDVSSTLDRVSKVAGANPRYANTALVVDELQSHIDGRFNRTQKLIEALADKVFEDKPKKGEKREKKPKVPKDEFNAEVKVIEDLQKQIRDLMIQFFEEASQVTQQDKFIRSDFFFYQNQLRSISDVYSKHRVVLDKISGPIDTLKDKIKEVEKEFNEVIATLDVELADKILRQYVKYTQRYAAVISEGPAIQAHLYSQIPEIVKKLNETYIEKKKDLNTSFEQIDYKNSMEKIAARFKEAKKEFDVLNIEKAKELIKSILKSIKVLERLINFEIKARNVFVQSYELVIAQTKETLENFVSIKQQLKELSGSGKQLPIEVLEKFEEIRTKGQEVDALALKFRDLMHDREVAFSSKLSRMKILISNDIELNDLLNQLIALLWSLNIETSITKNKFKRAEAALNEVIANVKRENIKLLDSEKKEFEYISKEITDISKSIAQEIITKEVTERIDNISKRVSSFYSAISGNVQIGKHVKNMLLELSPKRALDNKLNILLQNVERLFLEGEYAQALNYIIDYLEGRHK